MTSNNTLAKKTGIAALIYGIISVFALGAGGYLLFSGEHTPAGIILILSGISLFGWSCFTRSWLFANNKK